MGSRSDLAYIAGFLDGDGSLMLQVKSRSDSVRGVRFMATICFYQDSRHEDSLFWMKDVLKVGYISHRRDGITELRINGFNKVKDILLLLKPFVRFKKKQTEVLIEACNLLSSKRISVLSSNELKHLIDLVFIIKQENYKSHSSLTREALYERLGLTP